MGIMNRNIKYLGITTVALNLLYIIWLAFNITGLLGGVLFSSEFAISSLSFLFLFNHWNQQHTKHTKKKMVSGDSLDIFIPVVNEPKKIILATVQAALKIKYRNKKVYILDDGHRASIKRLAEILGCEYIRRDNNLDYKAGNMNHAFNGHSSGKYILALDADQVVKPEIAQELLGYFQKDDKLALITTRQKFSVPDNDFNHDNLFYEHMQTGKNADNAAVSCGSGVIYRRSAIEVIGGFQTWNVVEDLFTTYTLHREGYKSLYINKSYTIGTAPTDLKTIYKQRGVWAHDTLRMFIYKSPIFSKGLNLRQRFHYIEISMAYVVSALAIPLVFLLPATTLLTGQHVIENETLYLAFRIPSLISILFLFYYLSGKSFITSQFWASLWFVYLIALFKKPITKLNSSVVLGSNLSIQTPYT